jgi:hypothetical protein
MELREIVCSGKNTRFRIFSEGQVYLFEIPNQAIIDFLGEMVDCPSFVTENTDTFKKIAANAIKQNPLQENYTIDYQTIVDNFY